METQTQPAEDRRVPVSAEHIEVTPGVCGGKPRIAGTRIRVQDIYVWHELQGQTADAIVSKFPHLTLADVHAALAYYWDHREEIRQQMQEADALVEKFRKDHRSVLQEKLRQRNALDHSLPPG